MFQRNVANALAKRQRRRSYAKWEKLMVATDSRDFIFTFPLCSVLILVAESAKSQQCGTKAWGHSPTVPSKWPLDLLCVHLLSEFSEKCLSNWEIPCQCPLNNNIYIETLYRFLYSSMSFRHWKQLSTCLNTMSCIFCFWHHVSWKNCGLRKCVHRKSTWMQRKKKAWWAKWGV